MFYKRTNKIVSIILISLFNFSNNYIFVVVMNHVVKTTVARLILKS
jgi:hypothetical protein